MSIAGIDPGASGAIALLDHRVRVFDMPTRIVTISGKQRKRVDLLGLAQLVDMLERTVTLCVLEDVGPMPHDGPVQAFNFGWAACAPHAMAVTAGWRLELVRPAVWKTQMGLQGQGKEASRAMATKLFPDFAHLWPLKKHDGRAEAVLLAFYGSKLRT